MALGTLVKTLQNIMRKDAGINGDAQRIEQMTWMFFLKVYDAKEEEWEFHDDDYKSIIPEEYRWRNWAVDHKDGLALTGKELIAFVDTKLFPELSGLELPENPKLSQLIVKAAFTDANNYMKDGILLRQVINEIDSAVDFTEYKERHAFGEIYETILRDLQSAGNAGEFYTPRAVTKFMARTIKPKLGEKMADFACGTGGFLTSVLEELAPQIQTPGDKETYSSSVYGMEWKQLPYLLCATNMLLHDIDEPQIFHGDSLSKDVRDYRNNSEAQFDIILMNPPYGGASASSVKGNFPVAMYSAESSDLFVILAMYRLKKTGRAAIVLPEGFLAGEDSAKIEIKKKLLGEFNLHTIVKLPNTTFAPYATVATNILFIESGTQTSEIWFYQHRVPEGQKNYSKTRPIKESEFEAESNWWFDRRETSSAWRVTIDDVIANGYRLDFKNPSESDIEESTSLTELLKDIELSGNRINALVEQINASIKVAADD